MVDPAEWYKAFGSHRVSAYGAGRWHPKGSEPYDYIQLSLEDVQYNVSSRSPEGR